MKKGVKMFWIYWETYGVIVIFLIMLCVFWMLNPSILSINNIMQALSRSSIIAIAATGMTFAICSGGFDLSVGAVLSLATCVFASLIPGFGMIPALLAVIVVGIICGMLNGLVITKLKIQTFVATLAMGMVFKGASLIYTNGKKQMLSDTSNPNIAQLEFFTKSYTFPSSLSPDGMIRVQPVPILLMLIVFAIGLFFYKYSKFGVHTRSIGSNETASRTSGIKVDRVLIAVFAVTALTASISGVIRTAMLAQGGSQLGDGFELEAITATILGGTSLAGGKGNVLGSLIAALLLTFMRSGLNILNVSDEYQRLAIGLILLFSLSINGIRELTMEGEA